VHVQKSTCKQNQKKFTTQSLETYNPVKANSAQSRKLLGRFVKVLHNAIFHRSMGTSSYVNYHHILLASEMGRIDLHNLLMQTPNLLLFINNDTSFFLSMFFLHMDIICWATTLHN